MALDTNSTITVTYPNGGEYLTKNTSYNVTWSSQNLDNKVKIEYSTNGGTSWTLIANNVTNNGSYQWQTPDIMSNNCKVRITGVLGSPSDISNNVFTIQQITTSGSMPTDEHWVEPVTLTGDVIVPSDLTLYVESGTTVNIPNGKKIQVNGTLIADGATFQPTSGATWWGISFYNCSSSSEVVNCTITGSTYGLDMYYYSNVRLQLNDILLNHIGLFFSSYSDGNGAVSRNDIHSNDYGVYCINYCDPTLYQTGFINNDRAIYGNNSNCDFNLGSNSSEGQNSFLYSGDYDVYSTYSGTIQAQYNYWGGYPPDTTNNYGNTNCSNPLTTAPWYLSKSMPHLDASEQLTLSEITDTLGMAEMERAAELYRLKNYDLAAAQFNTIMTKYHEHFAAKRALVYLFKCQKNQKSSETATVLENVVTEYKDKKLEPLASHLLVCELLTQGKYESAISKLKDILTAKEHGELESNALYDIGTIYYYHLNDKKQGEIYLRELMDKFPDSYLTSFAASTLGEWTPDLKKNSLTNEKSIPNDFTLHQNYPNPFNPVTNIEYTLPEERRVVFEIYNVLGQKINTLLDANKEAGQYLVKWNGTNDAGRKVTAGIYFIRMRAGTFEKSIKVMLLP